MSSILREKKDFAVREYFYARKKLCPPVNTPHICISTSTLALPPAFVQVFITTCVMNTIMKTFLNEFFMS